MYITQEAIYRVKYHNYIRKNNPEAKRVNWAIHKSIRKLLYISMTKAGSCETLLLMHIPTHKFEMTTDYRVDSVNLTDRMRTVMIRHAGPYLSIHNHPNNSFFSVLDLTTFLSYNQMQLCFVIGNSGKVIHLIIKDEKEYRNKINEIIRDIISLLVNSNIINGHSSAKPYINILGHFGLKCRTYYYEE